MGHDTQTLRDSMQFQVNAIPDLWGLKNVKNKKDNEIVIFLKRA